MARNASKSGPKKQNQEKHPEKVYEALQLGRQIACYNYYIFLNTAGTVGWDPDKAGLVYHYRSSNYIAANIKQSSWAKIGKVSKYQLRCIFLFDRTCCRPTIDLVLFQSHNRQWQHLLAIYKIEELD